MRLLLSLSCALIALETAARTVCTSAGDLTAALRDARTAGETFALTATVSYVSTSIAFPAVNLAFADASGSSLCNTKDRRPLKDFPRPGAQALLRGFVEKDNMNRKFAVLTSYEELAFERPRPRHPRSRRDCPSQAPAQDLNANRGNHRHGT